MQRTAHNHATPARLAVQVRRVGQAINAGDEDTARAELRLLSDEAHRLATTHPFPLRPPAHNSPERRQRIKAEADPMGSIGC